MFKPIPFLTRKELATILDSCERVGDCLIRRRANPNVVALRGEFHTTTRVIWAEQRGDKGLDTHEVIHKSCCPNTGDGRDLCINIEHLELGTPASRNQNGKARS